jgi:hypothetical protein
MRFKLLLVAALGTLTGFWVTNTLIQSMSFWQFLAIEFVITILHLLYNIAKEQSTSK